MSIVEKLEKRTRLGFHYLPDMLHYGDKQAQVWLSEIENAGANWLYLPAPSERAIPESFLTPLIKAGITPVLHFEILLDSSNPAEDYQVLLSHYARQGVKYVVFYDRPNVRKNWTAPVWAQEDLVERFLDQFLPLAELALYNELVPVFPALEPGGDYWDLAFLRAALKSIQRRGNHRLAEVLGLAVYGRAGNRPLDWGAGGLDRWPGVRPYFDEPGLQDQRGFRTFDWYLDICNQELGRTLPIFLLKTGSQAGDNQDPNFPEVSPDDMVHRNLEIIRWLHSEPGEHTLSGNAPDEVLACFFDLDEAIGLWPGMEKLRPEQTRNNGAERQLASSAREALPRAVSQAKGFSDGGKKNSPSSLFHYILLPLYAWGAADWDLELISPLIQTGQPTVGFSLTEASQADRVTVVGGKEVYSDHALETLRRSGCVVERMLSDGTLVATM